jgi:type IV pilus assembly protein PilQ
MIRRLAFASLLPVLLAAAPLGDAPPSSRVTALRLEPSGSSTELTIEVDGGPVEWNDFSMSDPARVVIDVSGARNALSSERFDAIHRGGVLGVRASQYSADVVRVVVDLDMPSRYSVRRVGEGIRLTLAAGAPAFEPWRTGSAARSAARATQQEPVGARRQIQEPRARRITVTFQNADIRDVLASFAEFTGRSIVPGSGVQGTVTAEIRDQPWDIALETILRAYGLAAVELPSGIIRVDAIERLREREVQEPLVTQTFRINYVPAAEIAQTLTSLKTERGNIVANASTNTLIVTDVESVVNTVGSMVSQLDIQTPQVSIQAKIIFVNRTDVEELGVVYDLKDSRGNRLNRVVQTEDPRTGELTNANIISLGGNSIAALGNATTRVTGPSLETVLSLVLGRHTLVTFLEALQSAELSDVQAAPLITTLDNQEAEIFVGERTPIRVVDVGAQGGGGGAGGITAPRATAQLVETGIRLRVTPHITADRRILMQLRAERSSAQLAATDIGVIFQTQEGTTRLLVNDGETAVIGGLTVSELSQTRVGIPFLMDIPYLGALFRTTRSREQKRDLLIMVTPHIVDDRG